MLDMPEFPRLAGWTYQLPKFSIACQKFATDITRPDNFLLDTLEIWDYYPKYMISNLAFFYERVGKL